MDDSLKMRILSASHLSIMDFDKIYLKASLYHGMELIVNKESAFVPPSNPRWNDVSSGLIFFLFFVFRISFNFES